MTIERGNFENPRPIEESPTTTRPLDERMGALEIDLAEVALALSDSLDLVGIDVVQHGKRVAHMADATAAVLGLPDSERDDLFLAALLHDCGVSSSQVHQSLMTNFDWEGAPRHCVDGHQLLSGFEPFRRLGDIILRHHTRWNDEVLATLDPAIARAANLIHLVDRVDCLVRGSAERDLLLSRFKVRDRVVSLAGTWFSPELVAAFIEASDPEAFWLATESHHLERVIDDRSRHRRPRPAPVDSLRPLAEIFARIVDAKSVFTAEHSLGVARLAVYLGRQLQLSPNDCDRLEIAGLLHDVGKLRIKDEILDKQGPLDEREHSAIERHAFETFEILRRISAFREIAEWAAFHHEHVTGGGYPFHRHGDDLSLPARIVAVADVFQALSQHRPYRVALAPEKTLSILRTMVSEGHLDGEIVEVVAAHLGPCRDAAVNSRPLPIA